MSTLAIGIRRFKYSIESLFTPGRHNRIHITTDIQSNCFLRENIVARNCYIGRGCVINSAEIGAYTSIGAGAQIGGMEHPLDELSTSPALVGDACTFGVRTHIGHDVWIGADCIIRQGITIGDGAVIGANSFVNKNVEPYAVVAGSPARLIKYRPCKSMQDKIEASHFWEFPPKKARKLLLGIK